jgi:light-independent protochlorophyllide reductase subunit B
VAEVCQLAGLPLPDLDPAKSRWYAQSVDSTYLTGKRVFVFGDATHALAAARIARDEMGFDVVGLGTYSREFARDVRAQATEWGLEALITDNHLEVEAAIEALQPELILGTQMERHIAKRHGMPCAVISAPVHVQDFPARYSPQMGQEGSNVMFDTWIHPLMMGLEEHLLGMFREDFEFHGQAAPSHLGHGSHGTPSEPGAQSPSVGDAAPVAGASAPSHDTAQPSAPTAGQPGVWSPEAERELGKIPFFVRSKARRNTERFASEQGVHTITVETLYDAKAHYSR